MRGRPEMISFSREFSCRNIQFPPISNYPRPAQRSGSTDAFNASKSGLDLFSHTHATDERRLKNSPTWQFIKNCSPLSAGEFDSHWGSYVVNYRNLANFFGVPIGWLFGFYGVSTFVGYLTPNSVSLYIYTFYQ